MRGYRLMRSAMDAQVAEDPAGAAAGVGGGQGWSAREGFVWNGCCTHTSCSVGRILPSRQMSREATFGQPSLERLMAITSRRCHQNPPEAVPVVPWTPA